MNGISQQIYSAINIINQNIICNMFVKIKLYLYMLLYFFFYFCECMSSFHFRYNHAVIVWKELFINCEPKADNMKSDYYWNFDDSVMTAIQMAKSVARDNAQGQYFPAHLIKGLLHHDVGIREFLKAKNKDIAYFEEWADIRIDEFPVSGKVAEISYSPEVARVFDESDRIRARIGWPQITPLCLLAALAKPGIAYSVNQLKSFPVRENEIFDELLEGGIVDDGGRTEQSCSTGTATFSTKSESALYKYCVDLTQQAIEGKIRPIVCRDNELRLMMQILGRHGKPNVMITGDSGVGKTALVEGLAWAIANRKVPSFLQETAIFELDMGMLIAGASYKGEVEDRLKNIIRDLRNMDKAILFIDELHTLIDSRQGNVGSVSVLRPELAKGNITIIGVTTSDEYRKAIEPDQAFNRCFEELKLAEPDEASAVSMVSSLMDTYMGFHGLSISGQAVTESVRLAKRYVKDRCLPDSALDLIDRTFSAVKLMNETAGVGLASLQEELHKINPNGNKEQNEESGALSALRNFYFKMREILNPALVGMLSGEVDVASETDTGIIYGYLEQLLSEMAGQMKNPVLEIGVQEVAAVVSDKTGIPLGKLQSREKERLLNMENMLRERVVGQDHALKSLVDAILESRSGLNKPGQPIGSFFFLGPTGTGKTELAKALAEALFNDEKAMIRFDMSEFKEEHSAALLYGAPPGYVGYEEGGLLVNKIRQSPYSVVLFDEIEKAHSSVYDIFLQIMDEGKLHDRLGKEGDFSNAIVLFTSNVGSEWLADQINQGHYPTTTQLMEVMARYFRPEFLARLSEIVPFSPISDDILLKIFNIQFRNFSKLLEKQNMGIVLTDEVRSMLARKGFDPRYGARQVSGMIRTYLRRPISRLIIEGRLEPGKTLSVELGENEELVWNIES